MKIVSEMLRLFNLFNVPVPCLNHFPTGRACLPFPLEFPAGRRTKLFELFSANPSGEQLSKDRTIFRRARRPDFLTRAIQLAAASNYFSSSSRDQTGREEGDRTAAISGRTDARGARDIDTFPIYSRTHAPSRQKRGKLIP